MLEILCNLWAMYYRTGKAEQTYFCGKGYSKMLISIPAYSILGSPVGGTIQ